MLSDEIVPQKYDPNNLIDNVLRRLKLKNDAALCRALGVAAPIISKVRHGHLPVGGSLLIRLHEVSGLSIGAMRNLMGDRRDKFRISNVQHPGLKK